MSWLAHGVVFKCEIHTSSHYYTSFPVPEHRPEHARVALVLPDAVEWGDGEGEEGEALLLEGVVAVEEEEVQGIRRPVWWCIGVLLGKGVDCLSVRGCLARGVIRRRCGG